MEARLGRRDAALRQLARAAELNPREPVVATVRRRVEAGKPPTQQLVDDLLARENLA
jgi:hypothetical protein